MHLHFNMHRGGFFVEVCTRIALAFVCFLFCLSAAFVALLDPDAARLLALGLVLCIL